MNILVSACLLGINCSYKGGNKRNESVIRLKDRYNLIPVCPECYGGLPSPREPSEITDGRVLSRNGSDVTRQYKKGAEETLRLAELFDCKFAVMKEKSPSCGYGKIYDGTFSGVLTDGNGFAAELLSQNGIKVIGETKVNDEF